jgi:mannose-6-phosphate isomerase
LGAALRTRAVYALEPWLLPPVVWGSAELQRDWGKRAPADAKLGESWEASCVPGRDSIIEGEGAPLGAAVAANPAHFLGAGAAASFPLLVKLLATSTFLSVQVHPDDAQASRLEGSANGKHEAWVVLGAAPGAEVLAGLAPGATAEALFDAAVTGDAARVRDCLERHAVSAGDVVEVPPGCVHAPGPGLVLYEVQQPVDLTYRIFDWGRKGLDGKPRPLHVEKAREVLGEAVRPRIRRRGAAPAARPFSCERLVETRAFALDRWNADGREEVPAGRLLLVTCVGGRGALSAGPDRVELAPGRTCAIPAATRSVLVEGRGLELLASFKP